MAFVRRSRAQSLTVQSLTEPLAIRASRHHTATTLSPHHLQTNCIDTVMIMEVRWVQSRVCVSMEGCASPNAAHWCGSNGAGPRSRSSTDGWRDGHLLCCSLAVHGRCVCRCVVLFSSSQYLRSDHRLPCCRIPRFTNRVLSRAHRPSWIQSDGI